MKYHVEWLESALNELTSLWVDADSATRALITEAVAEIDRRLADDPETTGESRDEAWRLDFAYPLGYVFHVASDANVVTVLHVRLYRRRQR